MKKVALLSVLFMTFTLGVMAQDKTPKSPRITNESNIADVSYGQPSKKGRVIFGELVPYGKLWRTGANMSSDITFKQDVVFGGHEVKEGTYALFTIPGEADWTIILNSQPEQRGAGEYEKYKDKNVVEIKVPAKKTTEVREELFIGIVNGQLQIGWDDTEVTTPVRAK